MQETLIQQQQLGSSSGPLKYTNHPFTVLPQQFSSSTRHSSHLSSSRRLLLSLIPLTWIPHPPAQSWVVHFVTDRPDDSILFLMRTCSKNFTKKAPRSPRSAQGLQVHLTVVRMFGRVCMPDDSIARPDPRQHA